jgi:hypothetical protein
MVTVCAQCDGRMTAQRSTRVYCSESCKQRAKRARQRAPGPGSPFCLECGKPISLTGPGRRRRYCTDKCRDAAHHYRRRLERYRVAEPAAYRVAPDPAASDPGMAAALLPVLEAGRLWLAPENASPLDRLPG